MSTIFKIHKSAEGKQHNLLVVLCACALVAILTFGLFPHRTHAGSQTFNSSGTFTVPAYGTLTVQVWGGGGGGGGGGEAQVGGPIPTGSGGAGGNSSFNGAIFGYGGTGGSPSVGGVGGGGSGGSVNTTGGTGGNPSGSYGGTGGAGASGGAGGAGSYTSPMSCDFRGCTGGTVTPPGNGTAPGGGGGGYAPGGGGGGGGYSSITYTPGQLTSGAGVTVVVGGAGSSAAAPGALGRVTITWTDVAPPGTPGTPTFSNVTQTSLRANWTAASGATSYKVERCTGVGCSNFVQIQNTGNLYDDASGLTVNTSYSYRVRGSGLGGDGPYSGTGTQVTNNYGPADCADGIDNDSDGQIDYPADSGCANASGDEVGVGNQCVFTGCPLGYTLAGGQCYLNSCIVCGTGANLNNVVNSCNGNQVIDNCPSHGTGWTCSAGACVAPPPASIDISVLPKIVRSGDTTEVSWSAENVQSCAVTEDNPTINDSGCGAGWCAIPSGTKTSSAISRQTKYTLTCVPLSGGTVVDTATVGVAPRFREI